MRILLIQLYSEEQSPTSAPYSIEVLAGHLARTLPQWQSQLRVLDNRDPQALSALVKDQLRDPPEVIGISVMQGTHDLACTLLDALYAVLPMAAHRPQIVLGNTLPTYKPGLYLDRYAGLLIVKGFGELPLEQALLQLEAWYQEGCPVVGPDYRRVPGIIMQLDGCLHQTPVRWLRDYSVPVWVDPHKYFARIETSRGCHFDHCTFCTRPPREPGEPRWIRFPIEPVFETISRLADHGVQRFTFCDEDFIGDDPEFCFALADRIESLNAGLTFSFSTRADNILKLKSSDEENRQRRALLERLKQVGLTLLFVGCESFCDRQLKRFAKVNTAQGNIRALKLLEEIGIAAESGFIMFDPFVTIDDLLENIDNLERYELWRCTSQTISRIDVQDSSPLHTWVNRKGLIGDYDPNQMTYAYRFEHPDAQQIADWCQAWKSETDYAYRLARNAQRMALFDEFPNHVLIEAKRLNFDFVKDITRAFVSDPDRIPAIRQALEVRRDAVIRAMTEAIASPRVHAEMGDRLRAEISGFLGDRALAEPEAVGPFAPAIF